VPQQTATVNGIVPATNIIYLKQSTRKINNERMTQLKFQLPNEN
jgi:hypothetical protein